MEKYKIKKNINLVFQLVLITLFQLRGEGNMMKTADIRIDNFSFKNESTLNPFEQFQFSFEISNNSDKPVTFLSHNDIIVTLTSNSEQIYKRSLRLPVTSGQLIRAMSEKRNRVVPEPVTIMSKSKKSFTFNTFNTLPLIKASTVELAVFGVLSDGSVITSDSITVTIAKYRIIESNKIFLAEHLNVLVNPVIIEMDAIKKVVVYYSNHPVFDKIDTYYQQSKYPNYESIYAVFPCKDDIVKTIPIIAVNDIAYSNHLFMSLIYPTRIEIIKIPQGGHDIIHEYEKTAGIKSEKAKQCKKIKQYYNIDKLEFLVLLDDASQNAVCRLHKTMLGWEISKINTKVNLNSMEFEKINPMDLVQ